MSTPRAHPPAFLAIAGPTASGKTDLSLAVARTLGGEIISMDSRQVYRGMDVGTAKVSRAAQALVRHHGIDLVNPDQRYSAGSFARDARRWIGEIRERGRVPILVGGTGFFLRAILEPIFAEPQLREEQLQALRGYLKTQPSERLAAWVRRLDPERAELAVQGGAQRMGRTLEVALLTGRRLSEWHREAPAEGEAILGVVVRLDLPREEMDRRIDARVTEMISAGFVEEVRGLLEKGYAPDAPGLTAVGYKDLARSLRGEISLDEAVERVRHGTRRYARRQLTWLRNQLPAGSVVVDATASLEEQVGLTLGAWRAGGGSVAPPVTMKKEMTG
jgi:tRNA dimethylallyltransferase